ncbi:NAD-P-binding protein [Rhizodiscina lignyota]|uniref:NAD-P-binding protein n=1 Tax=Rhizodiscina lignyota TaxID=1504668 RepID=A0A9P4ITY8_9PEZI|nr:NAD-P-binding protein [Rhizodiscina lignyota]
MVHVALAGASSGFGLTLLHHLVKSKKHTITLLSRSAKPELSALGVNVCVVDYSNQGELVQVLTGVHTVISCMGAGAVLTESDPQLAVIEAARVAGVKRFAPSEFAHGSYEGVDLYRFKIPAWEAVQRSGTEYTRYSCGLFMNLLAPHNDEALAGLRPWNFVINMTAGTADLPGDGTTKVTYTEINDICRFVVASLDLEKWPAESMMSGDDASYIDVVKMIEKVRGGEKMLVRTNTIEDMEKMAEVPQKRFYNQARICIAKGGFEMKPTLNQLCPEVRPVSIEDFLRKWWVNKPIENPTWGEDKSFGFTKEE